MSGKKRRRAMNAISVNKLPYDFQRVEYIESTSVQGFVVDYIINNKDTEIYIDAQATLSSSAYLFGNAASLTDIRIFADISNESVLITSFASNKRNIMLDDRMARHKISIGKYLTVDGVTSPFVLSDSDVSSIENNTEKIALFALNGIIGLQASSYEKIYEFKISEAGVDVVHLIPCYRKDDNVIGMYDVINDRFYQNEGSREFLKGEDVN